MRIFEAQSACELYLLEVGRLKQKDAKANPNDISHPRLLIASKLPASSDDHRDVTDDNVFIVHRE